MFKNFIQKRFNWIYRNFCDDTSKMLIVTGTLGWILSSLAQAAGILANSKLSTEKKSFLLPQELIDGFINAITFIGITTIAKGCIAKMASTGKIAPLSVRNYLNKNSIYKNKVGKLDFKLDDVLPKDTKVMKSYKSYKNFVTTMGTIGASILSCNIATPLIRNAYASKIQKTYIDMVQGGSAYQNTNSGNMKI